MDKRTTWKKMLGILLTMVLMVPCIVMPAYAADGDGPYKITGEYKPNGVTLPAEAEFKLYKVGGFARKADDSSISILQLDEAFTKAEPKYTGNIDLGYSADGKKWKDEDWMNEALTLSNYLADKTFIEPAAATTSDGEFEFSGLSNGLYLLTSKDYQKVSKGGNDFTYYAPRPMFIQILNGNQTGISVKAKEENVKDFKVTKTWIDGDKNALRPTEITVERLYGGDPVDTITLTEKNDWTYEWESSEKEDKIAKEWTVREVMDEKTAESYYDTVSENIDNVNHVKLMNITNTYSRYDLEITKNTAELAKLSDGSNITAVFEIVGYRDGKEVYRTNAGAVIDDKVVKIPVNNIPRNLDEDGLKVTEVYAGGNYTVTPAGSQTATFVREVPEETSPDEQAETGEAAEEEAADANAGHYEVSFTNNLGDTTVISTGVVNKFEKITDGFEIVRRIGLETVAEH